MNYAPTRVIRKFPKTLYVHGKRQYKEKWFHADVSYPEEKGIPVGVYELKETKIVKVHITLE